jgi:hypothetical protein
MNRVFYIGSVVLLAGAMAVACGKESSSPVSPSGARPASGSATPPGGLKASAPTPQSPTNGVKPSGGLVLVAGASKMLFVADAIPLSYEFEILTPQGARVWSQVVPGGSEPTVSVSPNASLTFDQTYNWRVRATYNGAMGPWSANAAFVANQPTGYIRGNELYDPLTNGVTVGTVRGPVTWIPGVGVRLDSLDSWIVYELPQALEQGEYSALVSGVDTNSEGTKTRILAMAEGYGDVTENPGRMTVEKRGDGPTGGIAWRFITSSDQIETVGAERVVREFDANRTYFWEASWRNNFFNVLIRLDGANGPEHYGMGKPYEGFYHPEPHVVYAGGGPARGGATNQTVPGMIIRQIWVSPNPRPSFANQ